ncbi:50S ribosomal protein L25/general stress protein Ctc [Alistipes sp. OttesenSCG-928-L06]|nr:50S ribosomal protein L25/general stress protein Ctc [Alistipes sp. OttesenSCG-928-L06]
MKTLEIKAQKRTDFGKKGTKAVRNAERVPCVIYGAGESIPFSIDVKDLKQLIYTPNSYIINFDIEGQKETGVMREVQFHPVREEVLHIDFYKVQPGKPVAVDVPVRLEGNSEGVKLGGKLMLSKRKLRIQGEMSKLPDEIVVDVTELGLGKTVFVEDLSSDDYIFLTPPTTAVCAVKMTRAARGAAAAAAAAGK